MREVTFEEKIGELGVRLPPLESFWRTGDLTALRRDDEGHYYRSNYRRGPLLYALIAKHTPRVVLEFGTGRGYGALCMARALVEQGVDGRVYTIDLMDYHAKQPWPIDFGSGPQEPDLSCADVWPQRFEAAWLDRITRLKGHSFQVMHEWRRRGLPPVDFAFIDGGHRHDVVKHDFYSFLSVAGPRFLALFDDYVDKPGFGIAELVDDEIGPVFEAELIRTGETGARDPQLPDGGAHGGMVLIDSDRVRRQWREAFPASEIEDSLARSRRQWGRERTRARARVALRPLARLLRRR